MDYLKEQHDILQTCLTIIIRNIFRSYSGRNEIDLVMYMNGKKKPMKDN